MKRILSMLIVVFIMLSILSMTASAESYVNDLSSTPIFTDVSENMWHAAYVRNVYENGIMEGTSSTTFEPNSTLTRAMLVTILGRFAEKQYKADLKETAYYKKQFPDVKTDKWYSEYIVWANGNGIVNGYPDGTFRPEATVTREEAVLMISRMLFNPKITGNSGVYLLDDAPNEPFKDNEKIMAKTAARTYTEALVRMGVISGDQNGYFKPKANITRAETAKIITKLPETRCAEGDMLSAENVEFTFEGDNFTVSPEDEGLMPVSVIYDTAFCYSGSFYYATPRATINIEDAYFWQWDSLSSSLIIMEKGKVGSNTMYTIPENAEEGTYDITVITLLGYEVFPDRVTLVK